ncbi:MAG: hypothetical protein RL734_415 [Bacteroidota bacterium]
MRHLAFSTNHRIIMKHIILTLTLALLIGMPNLSINAGTISASGTLSKEVTSTTNTAPIEVKDCNGNVLSTIPSQAVTTTKYEPYAKNNQTVRFIVTRLENPVVSVVTIDKNINNDINYNATSGNFSVDLTDPSIVESRYNYKVQAKISEDSYPIGSVIAYLGNSGNVAGMETNGWFKCDGRLIDNLSALSADEKTALKNILGNSSNLPDLRGNFLRGLDEGRGWDDDAGTRTGGESTTGVRSQQGESMRKHTHSGTTSTNGLHDHGGETGDGGYQRTSDDGGTSGTAAENSGSHRHSISADGNHSHTFTTGDPGNSVGGITPTAGNENRPDNMAVYWIIRGR